MDRGARGWIDSSVGAEVGMVVGEIFGEARLQLVNKLARIIVI